MTANAQIWIVKVGTEPTPETRTPELAGEHVFGPFPTHTIATEWAEQVRASFAKAAKRKTTLWLYGEPYAKVEQLAYPGDADHAADNWYASL